MIFKWPATSHLIIKRIMNSRQNPSPKGGTRWCWPWTNTRSPWTKTPLVVAQWQILWLFTQKIQSATAIVRSYETAERKGLFPGVKILKLCNEEPKGASPPWPDETRSPGCTQDVAPHVGQLMVYASILLCSGKKHWTRFLLLWLLPLKFRNSFNLGYFRGWHGHAVSALL